MSYSQLNAAMSPYSKGSIHIESGYIYYFSSKEEFNGEKERTGVRMKMSQKDLEKLIFEGTLNEYTVSAHSFPTAIQKRS